MPIKMIFFPVSLILERNLFCFPLGEWFTKTSIFKLILLVSKKRVRSRAVLMNCSNEPSGALFFPFEGQKRYDVDKKNGTEIDKSFFGTFTQVEAEISSSA